MGRKRFTWSYSRYSVFDKCPQMFKFKHIDKLPEPPFHASERGILIHKKAEHFIKGDIIGMPKELKAFGSDLRELKRLKAEPEVDLAFTEAWEPSAYDDWDNVWCRVHADVVVPKHEEVIVIDHKTGKIYEDDIIKQAEINALGVFCHYDNVEKVRMEFWYYDLDEHREFEFTDFNALKRKWKQKAKKMEAEKEFPACAGYYCAWCTWSQKKGGCCDVG